jgi:hypothetical protein
LWIFVGTPRPAVVVLVAALALAAALARLVLLVLVVIVVLCAGAGQTEAGQDGHRRRPEGAQRVAPARGIGEAPDGVIELDVGWRRFGIEVEIGIWRVDDGSR